MTPKDKAKELVDRFYNVDMYDVDYGGGGCTCPAKQCALICVDEMIKNIIWSSDFNGSKRKELEEVRQEISKL